MYTLHTHTHLESIKSGRRRQVHAASICLFLVLDRMHLPEHAIKLILFKFFFCIFDSVFRTIQFHLFAFDFVRCDIDT